MYSHVSWHAHADQHDHAWSGQASCALQQHYNTSWGLQTVQLAHMHKWAHYQTQIAKIDDKVYPWGRNAYCMLWGSFCQSSLWCSDWSLSAKVTCVTYCATVWMRTITARLCRGAALDLTSIIWYMHEAHTSAAGNTTAGMFSFTIPLRWVYISKSLSLRIFDCVWNQLSMLDAFTGTAFPTLEQCMQTKTSMFIPQVPVTDASVAACTV